MVRREEIEPNCRQQEAIVAQRIPKTDKFAWTAKQTEIKRMHYRPALADPLAGQDAAVVDQKLQ